MSTATAPVVPLGCAVNGCGVPRRRHNDTDHRYQVPAMRTVLDRADARKTCGHWDGAARRVCGSQVGVRPFIQGPRCPVHDPNVLGDEGTAACQTCELPVSRWDPTDPLYLEGSGQCPGCTRADLDAEKHLEHAEVSA